MATFYADIDNAYVAVGAGTLVSPYNRNQLLAATLASGGGDIFLLAGTRLETLTTFVVLNTTAASIVWDAIDPQNPWRWIIDGGGDVVNDVGFRTAGIGTDPVEIRNGAIYVFNAANAQVTIGQNSPSPGICKNISFKVASNSYINNYGWRLYASNCQILGCSVELVHLKCLNTGGFTGSILRDSIFLFSADNAVMNNRGTITANNCVHNSSAGGLAGTEANVQDSYAPDIAFPDASSPKSAFSYDTITGAPGGPITVPASGSFTGYTKGLFGGKLRTTGAGIGGMWFGDPAGTQRRPGGMDGLGNVRSNPLS
jgi:hypothetical protein